MRSFEDIKKPTTRFHRNSEDEDDNDDRIQPELSITSSKWGFAMTFLHALYAFSISTCVVLFRHKMYYSNQRSSGIITLIWFTIAICLIIDNLRISGLLPVNLAFFLAQISYFSHEVLTPFGLLFIPAILLKMDSPYSGNTDAAWYISISTLAIFLSYKGFRRYQSLKGWKVEKVFGVYVCRPSNSSHAALIPIFLTVGGLIVAANLLLSSKSGNRDQLESLQVLLYAQVIVFIGNGAIGPHKLLMALLGNGFEVLWLWSIIQALLQAETPS